MAKKRYVTVLVVPVWCSPTFTRRARHRPLTMRSQTTRTVRYGRGGNAFCRSYYVAA